MAALSPQGEFLEYLESWLKNLPAANLKALLIYPEQTAIVSVDMTNGFCYVGPLSSPRVAAIVDPIRTLFSAAWSLGLRHILLSQDTHKADALEFAQWPPHCIRGTKECETVDELKSLPFFEQMMFLPKNSISAGLNTGLQSWIDLHSEVKNFIVVGDCTDLCIYQLAMYLRVDANEHHLERRVIVPADCIQTYDLSVAAAKSIGAVPHPGDLMHAVFLYHMALNGVEVVCTLEDL